MGMLGVAALAVTLERRVHLHADYVAFRSLLPTRMHDDAFPGLAPNRFAPLMDCGRHARPIGSRSPIKVRPVPPASDARQIPSISQLSVPPLSLANLKP